MVFLSKKIYIYLIFLKDGESSTYAFVLSWRHPVCDIITPVMWTSNTLVDEKPKKEALNAALLDQNKSHMPCFNGFLIFTWPIN